ncbi:hypothetical protein [Timonella sp. A28]|uniref:hypothetical protein n=1 Tax=Timonella sp. A28 TaxID=3442640 RepID=UPI003EBE777D
MTALIISVVSVVLGGGLVSALLIHKRESPKSKAEAAKTKAEEAEVLANTAIKLTTALSDRVATLEARDAAYRLHVGALNRHIENRLPPPPPDLPDILKSLA